MAEWRRWDWKDLIATWMSWWVKTIFQIWPNCTWLTVRDWQFRQLPRLENIETHCVWRLEFLLDWQLWPLHPRNWYWGGNAGAEVKLELWSWPGKFRYEQARYVIGWSTPGWKRLRGGTSFFYRKRSCHWWRTRCLNLQSEYWKAKMIPFWHIWWNLTTGLKIPGDLPPRMTLSSILSMVCDI